MAKRERKMLDSEKALKAFITRVGDKEMTPAQEKEHAGLLEAFKVERFRVVAAKHAEKILNGCAALSKCANRKKFSFTDAQVATLKAALEPAIQNVAAAFAGKAVTSRIQL